MLSRIAMFLILAGFLGGGYWIMGAPSPEAAPRAPLVVVDTGPADEFVEACRGSMREAREQFPHFKFKPGDTVEKFCDCSYALYEEIGATPEELRLLTEVNGSVTQMMGGSASMEDLQAIMAQQQRLETALGKDRVARFMQVGIKSLQCPGGMPSNMRELMGRG